MKRGHLAILVIGAALVTAIAFGAATARGDEGEGLQPIEFVHTVHDPPAPVTGAVFGTAPTTKTGTAICTTPTQNSANVNTDCEGVSPHNERSEERRVGKECRSRWSPHH